MGIEMRNEDRIALLNELTDLLNAHFQQAPYVLHGGTFEDDIEAWKRCLDYVRDLWQNATRSHRQGHYPMAAFLSLVVVEETAKLAWTKFEVALNMGRRSGQIPQGNAVQSEPKRATHWRAHTTKHKFAALCSLLVNTRIERLFGDPALRFFTDATDGKLESFRQSLLYIDLTAEGPRIPCMPAEVSALYVALAGEMLAEAGGFSQDEWHSILNEVEEFERAYFVCDLQADRDVDNRRDALHWITMAEQSKVKTA
jgi:AbiV family abortive infection protein